MEQIITRESFVLEKDGRLWMTAERLGEHLGFKNPRRSINTIVSRNFDELEPFQSDIKMMSHGKNYLTNIYDEQGCYIIAMLAKTKDAKIFRQELSKFLAEMRKNYANLLNAKKEYEHYRLLNAKAEFKYFLRTNRSYITKAKAEQIAKIKKEGLLSDTQLARAFGISKGPIAICYKLYRHAQGDFRDTRPKNFLPSRSKEPMMLLGNNVEPLSDALKKSEVGDENY